MYVLSVSQKTDNVNISEKIFAGIFQIPAERRLNGLFNCKRSR